MKVFNFFTQLIPKWMVWRSVNITFYEVFFHNASWKKIEFLNFFLILGLGTKLMCGEAYAMILNDLSIYAKY